MDVGYQAGSTFDLIGQNPNVQVAVDAIPVSVVAGIEILNASKQTLKHIETFCHGGILEKEAVGKKLKEMLCCPCKKQAEN